MESTTQIRLHKISDTPPGRARGRVEGGEWPYTLQTRGRFGYNLHFFPDDLSIHVPSSKTEVIRLRAGADVARLPAAEGNNTEQKLPNVMQRQRVQAPWVDKTRLV